MKRIVTILLMLAILLSLTSCKNNVSVKEIYFESLNYNNYYNFRCSCDLWINDDIYLYNSDGFYNMRTFAYQNSSKVKLFESNDFINETYYGEIFPINDFAYFTTSTDDNNQNFYKFSFANQSYEKLFTTSNYSEWMGTLNYIAFSQYRDEELTLTDLFIYNIVEDTITPICNDILSFGIVNNKIRYLTSLNTDTLVLFEYDHTDDKSNKIGEISVKSKEEGYITKINALQLGEYARIIGAGRLNKEDKINYEVGIVLNKKVGDYIKKDEELLKLYIDKTNIDEDNILKCFEINKKNKANTKLIKEIVM